MTKLKQGKNKKNLNLPTLQYQNAITVVGRGTLNRKVRLAEANAKTNRYFECLLFGLKIVDGHNSLSKVSTTSQNYFDLVYPSQFIVFPLCYY